jgi:hypothetical protein
VFHPYAARVIRLYLISVESHRMFGGVSPQEPLPAFAVRFLPGLPFAWVRLFGERKHRIASV